MLSYLTLCKVPGFELEPWILVPVLAISVISLAQRMTWQSWRLGMHRFKRSWDSQQDK